MNLKKAMHKNHAAMVRNDRERAAAAARRRREEDARIAAAMEPLQVAMLAQAVRVFQVTRNIPQETMLERIRTQHGPEMATKVAAEVEKWGPLTAWEMARSVAAYARLVTLGETK